MKRKLGIRKFKGRPFCYHLDHLIDNYPSSWYMRQDSKIQNKYFDIRSGETLYDVGATVGSWTLPTLVSGGHVMAFEPHPLFIPILEDNIMVNGYQYWNLIPKIVWSKSREWVRFYPYAMSTKKNSKLRADLAVMLMETITIDDLAKDFWCDWMKIDVEGAEVEVLKGAQKMLKKQHPKIILEWHKDLCEDFRPFLPGYQIKEIEDGKFFCQML